MNNIPSLPSNDDFQYFSHLYHSEQLIKLEEWSADTNWVPSDREAYRQNTLFQNDNSYIANKRVIDLGCHHGYYCYIAKTLGATSVHGINARQWPLDVANFAFNQLHQDNFSFKQGNLENNEFLKKELVDKDTVIFTEVLEHLRNPYAIFETITNSNVENLIFQCSIADAHLGTPLLVYYKQSTESNFSVFEEDKTIGMGSYPNLPWLTMVLYHLGWSIELLEESSIFNRDWFAIPNLDKFPPTVLPTVTILAKKFASNIDKNNFENY